jgi:hypothetical protein
MEITILDLINFKKLEGMKLIAGKNGLNRKVTDCGILDYELDSVLKDKYSYNNFKEEQFVITTFLYAKDDEHLIGEAVKYLADKKVSCLAIKNIYKLPIHDYVLRYADSKDFPIFMMESHNLYFEKIIVDINDCIKNNKNVEYGQKEIDSILNKSLDNNSIKNYVHQLNPSLLSHYITIYFYFKEKMTFQKFDEFMSKYKNSKFFTPLVSMLRYRNGMIMICSNEHIDKNEVDTRVEEIINALIEKKCNLYIGVSEIHHHLHEMKQSLNECIYASMMNKEEKSLYISYKNIGSYKAIFPFAQNYEMQLFSNKILAPIQDFDAENKLNLTETLIHFIKCLGSISELSKYLSLHENTIRNRMEKISTITGLNFRNLEHYEQLSLAVKIYICNNLFDEFY